MAVFHIHYTDTISYKIDGWIDRRLVVRALHSLVCLISNDTANKLHQGGSMESNPQGEMATPCKVTPCLSLSPQPMVSSHPTGHATCWYGVKGTKADQSCFKSFTGLRSGSLKFGEEIHDYEEYYKYGHVRQTYPWNKHTCTWNSENQTHYHMNGGDRRGSFLWIRVQISAFKVFVTHLNHKCIGSTKLG